jgi:hypothetical protein
MHTAMFHFHLRDINSKIEGHNAHDLLLYKPGWGRTKRTANKLQSKSLWQSLEGERSASIEEQLPAWANPCTWQTDPLKKRWSRFFWRIVEANNWLTGDKLDQRSCLM